jgi:hypothetical protein
MATLRVHLARTALRLRDGTMSTVPKLCPRRHRQGGIMMSKEPHLLADGEYAKWPEGGSWYAKPPGFKSVANLSQHTVVEHDDGTITVSPSILCTARDDDGKEIQWHGYLERGVWRKV